ncbi:golvesin C-terminal-like domain-containing protein [Streptomyces erythrochromogenes]|uniref:golvesin C-terminal-like domain-containing protein n=1 Tax=Streptomyces erythrochromogenes TaxID=285574 RepID=UPI00381030B8
MSLALLGALVESQAWATPDPGSAPSLNPSALSAEKRDGVLGKGWKESADRAFATSGDAAGFHLLVADKKAGYGWRSAASLSEPGFDADMWIGNACLTGSGKKAVVAYAPRTFTNKPELMARGAFTAVVDLDSGAVTKLRQQASLAYFSPGCGTGETAVLTQSGGEEKNATRLVKVDTKSGSVSPAVELEGQVTSAIPVGDDIVAADASRLVRIDNGGRRTPIADTAEVPFALAADAEGGVVYMDRPAAAATRNTAKAGTKEKAEVRRVAAGDIARTDAATVKPRVLAKGDLTDMDVAAGAGGQVLITGPTQPAQSLPRGVQRRPDAPKDAVPTTRGEALVTKVGWADGIDPRTSSAIVPRPVDIGVRVLATGKSADFTLTPSALSDAGGAAGRTASPALDAVAPSKKSDSSRAAAPAADAVAEPEASCAVPRNDPRKQAMQPKPRQVEWAVNRAITNTLNDHISRPANWKNLGMGAYQPQSLFPLRSLSTGGRIPAQVMLGITAQESNMWQASRVVTPGVTGNPLIGNYYGIKYAASGQQNDPWAIDWADADCGYGVTQVTDGMRKKGKEKPGETALPPLQQEAIALDYTANIAAGVNILADKWNMTHADGLVANNGDPQYVENWFFALWAYNSGYYPKVQAAQNGGLWGVGFTNNPANPLWKANRTPFLENAKGGDDYSHAAHPQDWPYQEKVIGWGQRPLEALESPGKMVAGYRFSWWNSNALRTAAKPSEGLFCTTANNCDPSKIGPNDKNEPGLGACNRADLKCWWNQPVTWKNCAKGECGYETFRFPNTYPEEADGTAYPPNCTTQGLPANALIVDDVPDGTPIHRPGCSQAKPNSGSFTLDFATPSARIDFQQLGAGYGGNFWFAHTRKSGAEGDRMKVTGTWKLNQALDKDAKVYVHLPDHGAHTKVATYEIKTANGWRQKTVSQPGTGNRWVPLGAYRFKGSVPEVRLTSITSDGTGDQDIAYDAVAFEPGTWNMLPEIVIPEADPNAPENDFVDNDRQKQPNPQGPTPPLKAREAPGINFLKAPEDCRETGNKGVRQCVTLDYEIGKYKSSMAKAPTLRSAAGSEDPLVSWCNDPNVTGYTVTRREGCHKLAVLTRWEKDGKTVGTAVFMVREETLVSNSKDFYQRMFVSPMSISPNLGTIKLDYWDALCTTNCSSSLEGVWSGATAWAPAGDSHWAIATRKYTWTKPTAGTFEDIDRGTVMKFSASSPEVAGSVVTKEPSWSFFDEIQCDNGAAVANSTGCVFGKHIPTWTADDKRYPPAAAYYWIMREKLPTHPGSKRHGTPMHRLKNPAMAKKNRETICNKSGSFAWTPNQLATPDKNDSVQCDEFPFAATQESGGSFLPIINGGPCVQLYAQKHTDGKWRIHEDERADPPTWSEICGRASMPGKDNMDAGRGPGLSGFYTKARVLDTRPFYMELPSYENCNLSEVCIPRS